MTEHTVDVDLLGSAADLDRLRVVIVRLGRRIRTTAPDSITASQLSTLGTVVNFGPCTIGAIAEIEHVQPPSASKIVAGLEASGLVERHHDPADRRCSLIAATDAGLALADEIRAAGRGWLAGQLPHLSAEQLRLVADALPALEQLLVPNEPAAGEQETSGPASDTTAEPRLR